MDGVNVGLQELQDALQKIQTAVSSVESTKSAIRTRYEQLGALWNDRKYRELGDVVNECVRALNDVLRTILQGEKYVLRLVQSVQEYEAVSLGPSGAAAAGAGSGGGSGGDGVKLNEFGVQSIEGIQGWIREINPNPYGDPRRNVNCGKCAAAVYQRLNGDSSATAGLGTYSIEEMNTLTGRIQTSMTPTEIERYLVGQGPGSHAVVGVDRASGAGHWFNAYYDGHRVYTIEGQGGTVGGWPPDYGNVVHWDVSI